MSARKSRPAEILRLVAMTLIGGLLVLGTRALFQFDWLLGSLFTGPDVKDAWIGGYYTFWAILIFGISTVATFAWYGLCCITVDKGPGQNARMKIPWFILCSLPVIAILVFVFFDYPTVILTSSQGTQVVNELVGGVARTLAMLLFILTGVLGYWLGTAINSPAPFKFIPPLSHTLRQLLNIL